MASTRVLAADGGMAHARVLQLETELWIGDFDSSSARLLAEHSEVKRVIYPPDKDASDGELAIETAMNLGAHHINLIGGLGRRTDYTLAHMTLLWRLARQGITSVISNGQEEIHPVLGSDGPGGFGSTNELAPAVPQGTRLSVVPWTDLKSLSLSGVRWPLELRDVACGSTLTLSNLTTSGTTRVTLAGGKALLILAHGPQDA